MNSPNDLAKSIVEHAVVEIPDAGWLIGALLAIFWPESPEDVWAEIKDRVEEEIDKKIDAQVFKSLVADLDGLRSVLMAYRDATKLSDDLSYISSSHIAAAAIFMSAIPRFKSPGHEVLLLRLYAPVANMHLGLLRDGVLHGKSWGWKQDTIELNEKDLKAAIKGICSYTSSDNSSFNIGGWRRHEITYAFDTGRPK